MIDILKKSVGLGYFLEYLAEIKSKYLLDFWLEAETVHMVLETNYSRKSPTIRRRLSRTKSLSISNKKGQASKETTENLKTDENIENKDKENLPVSHEAIFDSTQEANDSKNTYDEPLNRRPSTLRTYEEFKTRAKSRSIYLFLF